MSESPLIEYKESWHDEYLKWICGSFEKICTLCKEYGIPAPEYTVHRNDIMMMFRASEPVNAPETEELHSNCTVNVPEIALKTFSALKSNPRATAKELSEALGISLRTVKNHLALLKQSGCINRVGSDKSGYWEITE